MRQLRRHACRRGGRNPDIGCGHHRRRAEETRRRNADDRDELTADTNRLADYRRIAAELRLPEAVADHSGLRSLGRVLVCAEYASNRGRRPKYLEVVRCGEV